MSDAAGGALDLVVGPAIVAAAIGTVGAFWARVWLEQRARRRRMRDLEVALAAEIRAYVAALERDGLAAALEAMKGRILRGAAEDDAEVADGLAPEGRRGFTPFIPREANDTVFRALIGDLPVLPASLVDRVTVYYQQIAALAALIEDMRAPEFAALSQTRKAGIYDSYIQMKIEALRLGRAAVDALTAHIEGGDLSLAMQVRRERAERAGAGAPDAVSSPASGRSGR